MIPKIPRQQAIQSVKSSSELAQALIAEGLLPPDCRTAEIYAPIHGVVTLRYEVYVQEDQLPAIERAVAKVPKELR